ncbi:MAG: hypothetical protein V1716_04385 [Candidatus Uhrbacteria bacterium]
MGILAMIGERAPHDIDWLLRLAAHSRSVTAFGKLVAWSGQHGTFGHLNSAFDRIMGNADDPAYADLTMIVGNRQSQNAMSALAAVV